ncbi:hypothetical protein HYH03_012478 [Edaphochlamys debaryana]|uniref:Ribosome biogenesis protein WDR12 homolog n=1 Tax=Edaphochlamys debaryana TaxID=47281 RepID=A0A836BU45_9CHLO|nr:hypothetical protein HYH03_012478 [Edaphochlamys debaryana]|eukprot:KAG2489040.1 hypothetical protein HYH03_012478 [Edaphochlamys debaryana]
MAAEESQVLVKFITKLPPHLRVPETPVAVPASLRRYGLSQVINHLLALDAPRPFDFLVSGQLLRSSLEAHLLLAGLSAESTLEVEYVPAVVPPRHRSSAPHDDWVSSVDGSRAGPSPSPSAPGTGLLVSGSYDGLVRLWNGELQAVASVSAHAGGVTSVRMLPSSHGDLLLTAGKDRAVRLWRLEHPGSKAPSLALLASYAAHTDSVEAAVPSPSGSRVASSGWDGRVLVWDSGRAVADAADEAAAAGGGGGEDGRKKKRRVGGGGGAAEGGGGGLTVSEPAAELRGHLHCVSCLAWPEEGALFSGGWDHSVRRWDVSSGTVADSHHGSKAVLALASHPAAPSVVAFSGADRAIRLWDARAPPSASGAMAVSVVGEHPGWVAALAWAPASQHHLASAGYEGAVKLWDVRGRVPLATLEGHTGKALCVGWLGGAGAGGKKGEAGAGAGPMGGLGGIVSGGADCALRVYDREGEAEGERNARG